MTLPQKQASAEAPQLPLISGPWGHRLTDLAHSAPSQVVRNGVGERRTLWGGTT